MNIVLIGYRACGKTTVGRMIAAKLQRPFFDTDALVQEHVGKTIQKIVAEGGWKAFRKEERAVIQQIARHDGVVISLGGGAVLDRRNVSDLKRKGSFFWLTADAATIRNRLLQTQESNEQRPPLSGGDAIGEVEIILKERDPIYRWIADGAIDTSRMSVEEVVAEIATALEKLTKGKQEGREQYVRQHDG